MDFEWDLGRDLPVRARFGHDLLRPPVERPHVGRGGLEALAEPLEGPAPWRV
jgi:hypothetical protein